jgi:hypothetical protein
MMACSSAAASAVLLPRSQCPGLLHSFEQFKNTRSALGHSIAFTEPLSLLLFWRPQ